MALPATPAVSLATLRPTALSASVCTMDLAAMAIMLEDAASEEATVAEETALVEEADLEEEIPTIKSLALEQV